MDPTQITYVIFSVAQFILAIVAAYVAFLLRRTFRGGLFEKAWQVIGMSPLLYAAGQLVELYEATIEETASTQVLSGVLEIAFLGALVYGFFTFERAWKPPRQTSRGA